MYDAPNPHSSPKNSSHICLSRIKELLSLTIDSWVPIYFNETTTFDYRQKCNIDHYISRYRLWKFLWCDFPVQLPFVTSIMLREFGSKIYNIFRDTRTNKYFNISTNLYIMYEENTKETLKILVALKLPITKSPSRPPSPPLSSSCLPGSQMKTDASLSSLW